MFLYLFKKCGLCETAYYACIYLLGSGTLLVSCRREFVQETFVVWVRNEGLPCAFVRRGSQKYHYLKEIRKRCVIFIFVPKRKLLGNYEVYCNILTTSLLSGILEKGSRYGKRLRYMQIRIQFVQLYKINVGLLFFPNLYLFQFAKRAIIKHESLKTK